MIYLDHAATTPVAREVMETVDEVLQSFWGNPSSLHRLGFQAQKKLEQARKTIAEYMGVRPKTLVFTSCATESNNAVLTGTFGYAAQGATTGRNLVVSAVEHSSIYEWAKEYEKAGGEVRWIPVDDTGRITPEAVLPLVDENTALVCAMWVNNELGTISPVEELARAVHRKNPRTRVLIDGVQAFGKAKMALASGEIDYFSATGHKIGVPKGIGLLYVREGVALKPLLLGGGQERGMRPGTENVAYACGLARGVERMQTCPDVRDLSAQVRSFFAGKPGVRINSPSEGCSPYILNLGFTGVRSEVLLHMMEEKEMYLSSGSACTGGAVSHVLQAVGVPENVLYGSVRLSFGLENTKEEIEAFCPALETAVEQIRSLVGNV
uniref:cysteine desulfurase family protein n=1 Tax=Ndongobacter massiliensis TaxID=1871025 RepID=UPI000930621A|nr:cysteine desulfurase family protein [Ndongobacter massiliensis]